MAMAMVFPATNVRFPQPVISAGTSSNQKRMCAVPARQQRVVSVRAASSAAAAAAAEDVDAAAATAGAGASAGEDAAEAAAAQVDAGESSSTGVAPSGKLSKKAKLAIRSSNKQILSLRFLWMEKNIGIALDQIVPGHGTIPLSPFYFWPKKDAWEELKAKLESKPWISRRRTIILLNQATDIINLWQQKALTF